MNNALLRSLVFWCLFEALLYASGKVTAMIPFDWTRFTYAILGTCGVLMLIWIFLRVEKKSFKNIGLSWEKNTLPKFLAGLFIGTVIMVIALLVLTGFTSLQFKRSSNLIQPLTWAMYLMVIIPLALMEELAFRSYAFLKLNTAYGLWWAQFMAAVAFALYHVLSGWSWQVSFLGPFVWAFVFGLAAIASRGIALPTGIHTALNFLQMLTGMKADKQSLWILDLEQNHSASAQAKVDMVGILFQIFILITALLCTWFFLKRKLKE
jgi:membrane protease YdiL (CAAX protease family)